MPNPKRQERESAGRRTVEALAEYALESGAAGSIDDLLDQVAAVRGRKLFNALLAVLQMPHATMLCSSADWERKWRRRVRPEQRPLVLLFPFGPVEFVFDVSQTEPMAGARPLPIDATPFAMDSIADARSVLADLSAAVEPLGVRVLSARQGVALAGKIRRTDEAGSLRVVPNKGKGAAREIPVRWVVALNESHSPTEQLATLAHELGHLFCGHVGADQGDSWPNRLVSDELSREVEAESVAQLVFKKLWPGVELPAYLDEADLRSPRVGWTYVAQAADKITELIGRDEGFGGDEALVLAAEPLPWMSDLEIRAGGDQAAEAVLIRVTEDEQGLPERVAESWAASFADTVVPWIVLARSAEAYNGLLSYFAHAPGEEVKSQVVV